MSADVTTAPNRAEDRPITTIGTPRASRAVRWLWSATWPKLLAVGIVVLAWQLAYLAEWKPSYILPSPAAVGERLWDEMVGSPRGSDATSLWEEIALTMRRGLLGYTFAIGIGTAIGIGVVQWRTMRQAIGSLVAGLQTMPSIAWFPLAILFFGLSESAIMFVVVLGAAPSIAAGVITGIDEVPPPLLRAGKMIGATGINRYRYIVLPAAMPSYLAGLKQGWAFSWRSLLAGELLVPIGGAASLGGALSYARTVPNGAPWLLSVMVVILVIGMVVDAVFGILTRRIRDKRGLTGAVSA